MKRNGFPPLVADLMDDARTDLANWVGGNGSALWISAADIKDKIATLAMEAAPHELSMLLRMAGRETILATDTPPAPIAVSAEEAIRLLIVSMVEQDLWNAWGELYAQAQAEG
jgi:hypothetical protein